MRWAVIGAAVSLTAGLATVDAGCSGSPTDPPDAEAGPDSVGLTNPDSQVGPWDAGPRLTPHDHVFLSNPQIAAIYVSDVDAGGMTSMDYLIDWLVSSPYWGYLNEYGVGAGDLAGSVRIQTSALIHPGDVDPNTNLIELVVLNQRVAELLHGADGGAPAVSIPGAQAYVIYLPDGINVALGHRGSYTYQTCIDANGYHAYDSYEPYAVMPPCDVGRSLYASSHEIAEMSTDPQPYHGWVSDVDLSTNGGEVADICEDQVMQEGVIVTRLWSNAQSRCVP